MSLARGKSLELDDIQAAALEQRPTPYSGAYLALRIDDKKQAREFVRRLIPAVESVATFDHVKQASLAVAISYQGLVAIGVPEDSLITFPQAFREGMAARAAEINDIGDSAPENWETPLGSKDMHIVVAGLAIDDTQAEPIVKLIRDSLDELPGVAIIWQQDVHVGPDEKEPFGFRDSIGQPVIEGTGIPGTNPHEVALKAGEFVLGYQDETGDTAPTPQPEALGLNGTYVAFRKLQTRVADFRRYIHERAADGKDEELIAAKFVGRWPSGAPLALTPDVDDAELGKDVKRNNAFMYGDDPQGLKCPVGAHARRMNPRDANVTGEVRLHRMIRRGTTYGPPLPPGVTEDDGVDRGIMFAFVGAHLERQFEFVQKQWLNDGKFIGVPDELDPLAGENQGGQFTVPRQPIRRRFKGLPAFVVNRGGEYCFMPGLRALRWITDLDT